MFERMRAGWRLAKAVRLSVAKDRGLYLFPIVSGIIGFLLFVFTFVALYFAFPINFSQNISQNNAYYYAAAFVCVYIAVGFTSTYFLLALLIAYRSFYSESPISFRDALSQAWSYKKWIFEWALFYTILMVLLRILESRFRGIIRIVVAAATSLAITIATFFAVPAILNKRIGPIKAVEESVHTIKNNFGMTFGGVIYVDLYTLMFSLSGILLFIAGIFLVGYTGIFFLAFIIMAGIVLLVLGVILNYTYMNILKLILYDYLNGEGLPAGINEDLVKGAIRKRARGRRGSRQYEEMDLQ